MTNLSTSGGFSLLVYQFKKWDTPLSLSGIKSHCFFISCSLWQQQTNHTCSQPGQCLYLQLLTGSEFLINYSISRIVLESRGKSMRTPWRGAAMKSLLKASHSSAAVWGHWDTRGFEAEAAVLSHINHHLSHPPPQIQLSAYHQIYFLVWKGFQPYRGGQLVRKHKISNNTKKTVSHHPLKPPVPISLQICLSSLQAHIFFFCPLHS